MALDSPTDWIAVARQLAPEIGARAAQHDADGSFVAENYAALKATGLVSAGVPAELGGGGASYGDLAEMLRLLAQHCGSTALAFSMHTHQVATAAWRWRHQMARVDGLLRRVAAERLVLISSGGSDWLPGSGTAERVEGGYRITARKVFASGVPAGDLLLTSAVHGQEVLHFAVPLRAPEVRVIDTWRVMGMRGTGSNDVAIEGFFVADATVSGRRPRDLWHPLFHAISMLAFPLIYSVYLGIAEAARDRALALARKRTDDPNLVYAAGEMDRELLAARLARQHMVRIAETSDIGPATTNSIMTAKALVAAAAIRTVERAMEVAGGASFYCDKGLERLFRDVQGARFHPLQDRAQLRMAGRLALGLPIDEAAA